MAVIDDVLVPVCLLHEKFECDAAQGVLIHKPRPDNSRGNRTFNAQHAGKIAGGRPQSKGYLQIRVTDIYGGSRLVVVHRVIWAMVTGAWPVDQIDHIDNNKQNNAFVNLRECTTSQNCMNVRPRSANITGFKGVSPKSASDKYAAQISITGRVTHLGSFDDPREAAKVYDAAAIEHFGEFARTNAAMGLL